MVPRTKPKNANQLIFDRMKYTFLNNIKMATAIVMCSVLLLSCSKWDEYKKYQVDGEILYSGKLESVKINPGNGRAEITGLLKADPKVKKVKVLWNGGKDSVVYDVNISADGREFSQIFPIEEGIKSFVIYTYDAVGNRSVAVNVIGQIYGPRYANSLTNRVLSGAAATPDGKTNISWLPMDEASAAFATEVKYNSTTGEKILRVPVETEITTLTDVDPTTTSFSYRTLYLPKATSIDIFYTDYTQVGIFRDVTAEFLSNTKVPMSYTASGGRWSNPADWITNDAVRNFRQSPGVFFGGVDRDFGGPQLAMEAGWSTDNMVSIVNGKIYQSPILPPGLYTFEMDIPDCTSGGDFYTVAAEGDGIPNTETVASSLAYAKTNSSGTHKITFTITTAKKVSLGFVGNVPNKGGGDGTFWRISGVRLKQLPLLD